MKERRREIGEERSGEEGEKEDMQFAATEHNVEPIFLYKNVKSNKADNKKWHY